MIAIEKIDALTVKFVHAKCEERDPGLALETVYRWRQALMAGKGISDGRKALLIEATADTPQALAWTDFIPTAAAPADPLPHVRAREDVQ